MTTKKTRKNDENDKALLTKEMTLSNIGNDLFLGDSAATSHMTSNKTGVYDLTPIRGSVMIGNGERASVVHIKGNWMSYASIEMDQWPERHGMLR